jgi:hypothetical protein
MPQRRRGSRKSVRKGLTGPDRRRTADLYFRWLFSRKIEAEKNAATAA